MNILSKYLLPSYYGLGKTGFWRLGGNGSLTHWMSQWIHYKSVCRTAPATPGLFLSQVVYFIDNWRFKIPNWAIPWQNKEKKVNLKKLHFYKEIWNMVLIWVLPILATVLFLRPFCNFFCKFWKKDTFWKVHFRIFNLVSRDLNKCIYISDSLSFKKIMFISSL